MPTKFTARNQDLVAAAMTVIGKQHPMTLRSWYYQLAQAHKLAFTSKGYNRLKHVAKRLREGGDVPFDWIVDGTRATVKPASWSGLADYAESVCDLYRKDLWQSMPHSPHVFMEKDAMAGVVAPVTRRYDVPLHVIRGSVSISFAGEIAEEWRLTQKPIYAYYLGDHDPKGHDIERDLKEKLIRYSGLRLVDLSHSSGDGRLAVLVSLKHVRADVSRGGKDSMVGLVYWIRLAIFPDDIEDFGLLTLPLKAKDACAKAFEERYGDECVELDALPPNELRRRVREAVEAHIDQDKWAKLKRVEELEKKTVVDLLQNLGKKKRK